MNMIKRLISGKSIRRRSLERETAARARRARDHLEKKRDRERTRLARDRARHEISVSRRRALRVLSPVLFVAAFAIGSQIAPLLVEKIWLQTKVIDRVAVQGAVALTPAAIAASAGALEGLPLSQIDPQQVAEQLAADPWIESARALRLPSGTLVVRVVEREAIARWQIGGRTDLIDPEGSRFAGAIEPGGPLPYCRRRHPRARTPSQRSPCDSRSRRPTRVADPRLECDPPVLARARDRRRGDPAWIHLRLCARTRRRRSPGLARATTLFTACCALGLTPRSRRGCDPSRCADRFTVRRPCGFANRVHLWVEVGHKRRQGPDGSGRPC